MSRFERTYSRDLLSSFRRSRTLGIKRLWVARFVRPPGDSRDCSSMMWQDIWAQGTETAGGEGTLLIRPGKYKCPTQTGQVNRATGNYIHFPQLTSPHTQWIAEFRNERILSINSKRNSPIFERKRHTISVWVCLWSAPFRDKPELRSICPAGMVHTCTKTQEVKTKFDQQKVNMHGILKTNLQSLKQS